MDPPPLSLADVAHDSDFPIDPVLDPDNQDLFLPEEPADPSKRHDTLDAANGINHDDHLEAGLDDAAVSAIKASLSQAQAQADSHHANGSNTVATAYGAGTEENPIENPTIHMAPYSRPERGEGTPHPEYMVFPMREMFLDWLKGESSWCHFVQRRTTTPAKRAEERMKARLKAHEKMLMEMSPDEAANVPPSKRRKRMRTSPVSEKITYTCHHAGSYTSKHSADSPQAKLRSKTKASVKCNCPARIVLTESEGGVCRIVYYWKHDGHDPFSEGELDTGRLPKVVDDWLIEQINAGKDTDEIRRMLSISEEAKQEYVRKALEDPSSVDPTMPPPIAFQMKIKYPDIYNRFRKLRGPIRSIKIPKCRQDQFLNVPSPTTGQSTEETANRVHSLKATANDEADEPPLDSPDNLDVAGVGVDGMDISPSTDAGVDHQFDTDIQVNDLDPHPHAVLARFAEQQGHSDSAQASLSSPRDPVPGEETEKFEESVAKAAKAAAEVAEQEEDEKSDGWGDINPL